MRPQAELLIAIINDPKRVDEHYLTSRGQEQRSAINDFDLSLYCLDVDYRISATDWSVIVTSQFGILVISLLIRLPLHQRVYNYFFSNLLLYFRE